MNQDIKNIGSPVEKQLNVGNNEGSIYLSNQSRLSARFQKLQEEVARNERYEGVKEALKYYLTKLDGIDMPTKLLDGNFSEGEILRATRRKEKYAKQLEKNKFFVSAQLIDSEIFAKLILDFEAHVEELISSGAEKAEIKKAVQEKVIDPAYQLINDEGMNDSVLNYTIEDLYGMLYFLTGKCHINWKNYDSL